MPEFRSARHDPPPARRGDANGRLCDAAAPKWPAGEPGRPARWREATKSRDGITERAAFAEDLDTRLRALVDRAIMGFGIVAAGLLVGLVVLKFVPSRKGG